MANRSVDIEDVDIKYYQNDVEDNLGEVDEMRFVEGNVMETNSDNEREEFREEVMVTVVPMSEVRQKVTDEDSDDLDDPSGLSKHLPRTLLGGEGEIRIRGQG